MSLKNISKIATSVSTPRIRFYPDDLRNVFSYRKCLHRAYNWRDIISNPQRRWGRLIIARKSNGHMIVLPNPECFLDQFLLPCGNVCLLSGMQFPCSTIVTNCPSKPCALYASEKSVEGVSACNSPSTLSSHTICQRNYATWQQTGVLLSEFTCSPDSSRQEHLLLRAKNETSGVAIADTYTKQVKINGNNMINLSDFNANDEDYILLEQLDDDANVANYFQVLSKRTMDNDQEFYLLKECKQILNTNDELWELKENATKKQQNREISNNRHSRRKQMDKHNHDRSHRHRLLAGTHTICIEMYKNGGSKHVLHESRLDPSEKDLGLTAYKNDNEKLVAKHVSTLNKIKLESNKYNVGKDHKVNLLKINMFDKNQVRRNFGNFNNHEIKKATDIAKKVEHPNAIPGGRRNSFKNKDMLQTPNESAVINATDGEHDFQQNSVSKPLPDTRNGTVKNAAHVLEPKFFKPELGKMVHKYIKSVKVSPKNMNVRMSQITADSRGIPTLDQSFIRTDLEPSIGESDSGETDTCSISMALEAISLEIMKLPYIEHEGTETSNTTRNTKTFSNRHNVEERKTNIMRTLMPSTPEDNTNRNELPSNPTGPSSQQKAQPTVDNAAYLKQESEIMFPNPGTFRSAVNVQTNNDDTYHQMETKPCSQFQKQFHFKNFMKTPILKIPCNQFSSIAYNKNLQDRREPETSSKEHILLNPLRILQSKQQNLQRKETKANTVDRNQSKTEERQLVNPLHLVHSKTKKATEICESKKHVLDLNEKVSSIAKPKENKAVETTQTATTGGVGTLKQSAGQMESKPNNKSNEKTAKASPSIETQRMQLNREKQCIFGKSFTSCTENAHETSIEVSIVKQKQDSKTSQNQTIKHCETQNQRYKNTVKLNALQTLEENSDSDLPNLPMKSKVSISDTTLLSKKTSVNDEQATKNISHASLTLGEQTPEPTQDSTSKTGQQKQEVTELEQKQEEGSPVAETAAQNVCAQPSDLLKFQAILSLANTDNPSTDKQNYSQTIDQLPIHLQWLPRNQRQKPYTQFPVGCASEKLQLRDLLQEHKPLQSATKHIQHLESETRSLEQPIQKELQHSGIQEHPHLKFIKQPEIKTKPNNICNGLYPRYGKLNGILTTFRGGHSIKNYKPAFAEKQLEPKNPKWEISNMKYVRAKDDAPKNTKDLLKKLTKHLHADSEKKRIRKNLVLALRDPTASSFEHRSNTDTVNQASTAKGLSSKANVSHQRHLNNLPSSDDKFLSNKYLMEIKSRTKQLSRSSKNISTNIMANLQMPGEQNANSQKSPDQLKSLPKPKFMRVVPLMLKVSSQNKFIPMLDENKPLVNPMLMLRNNGQRNSSDQDSQHTRSHEIDNDNSELSSVRNSQHSRQPKRHQRSDESQSFVEQPTAKATLTSWQLSKYRQGATYRYAPSNVPRQHKFVYPKPNKAVDY